MTKHLPYLLPLLVFLLAGTLPASGNLPRPDAVADRYGAVWVPPKNESFAYDADGNRQSSSLWNYRWDGRNMLVEADTQNYATAPEGWHITFDYDSEGRRFRKNITHRTTNNGVAQMTQETVTFLWKGWDLVYERHTDPYGNFLYERKYVWGADLGGSPGSLGGAGGLLVMRETRGQTTTDYYPLYDGCGHVVALSDSNGNLVASYAYGPFGELISASGSMAATNPWCWATKYYDSETGLYYFGHRYYDPATGQWLNREPLGEDESLNLYAYCHNDPVNGVDARGMEERVIAGSDPVFVQDPKDPYAVLMGFPLEENGWFSSFAPNGKYGLVRIPITKEAVMQYAAHPELIGRMRESASAQLKVIRLNGPVFYIGNSIGLAGGVGEMAAGVAAAPESAGVSTVATVHGFDVASTRWRRLWSGPGSDIQTGTSRMLQMIPGIDRDTAEIGDNLISFAISGGTMYVVGKGPLIFATQSTDVAANSVTLEANAIRFSQSNVRSSLPEITASMKANGWQGSPIDVVRMADGSLTAVDNTRLAAASLSNTPVQATIRNFGEAFPASRAGGNLQGGTWGEALMNRIGGQKPGWQRLYPNGSPVTGVNPTTPGFSP